MVDKQLVVAVDFDNTIVSYDRFKDVYTFGKPLDGAREFLEQLSKFAKIIIHTCRCTPSVVAPDLSPNILKRLIVNYMIVNNLSFDNVWCDLGKPNADIFIDDKGFRVNRNPSRQDYESYLVEIKKIFGIN